MMREFMIRDVNGAVGDVSDRAKEAIEASAISPGGLRRLN
jgi:hypothetical protein